MAIPWVQILRWTPQIVSVSRDLLQRSKRNERKAVAAVPRVDDRAELRERLAALEENEVQQAALVEQMAEQQAAIAKALGTLHERQRVLTAVLIVTALLAAVACIAAAWLALR